MTELSGGSWCCINKNLAASYGLHLRQVSLGGREQGFPRTLRLWEQRPAARRLDGKVRTSLPTPLSLVANLHR